jgi:predicted DsbA family dithiol-disulfide isomerase
MTGMNKTLKIDFVSDVSCPWCAVGLGALEQALHNLQGEVQATLRFQPFELNPQMGPEGEDVGEHLGRKYGSTAEQQAQIRETIRQRGAEVGFEFNPEGRGRVWNTFDAHRLLHWAAEEHPQRQRDLKMALLLACHRDRAAMASHEVLVQAAAQAGLDAAAAREVLASGRFADEVRDTEAFYQSAGIHAVPAVVINDRHLISGGQPAEVFERALRQLAQETQPTA